MGQYLDTDLLCHFVHRRHRRWRRRHSFASAPYFLNSLKDIHEYNVRYRGCSLFIYINIYIWATTDNWWVFDKQRYFECIIFLEYVSLYLNRLFRLFCELWPIYYMNPTNVIYLKKWSQSCVMHFCVLVEPTKLDAFA